ncbi:MAG: heavy metal-associated domain-containing protein [Bacteroidetes bacterium]|nr:heavy metal-associated domain-containing protein [Bacteroidota bacterium]
MKNLRTVFLSSIIIILVLFTKSAIAQNVSAVIKIKTSAICGMCKKTIEKHLANEKGISKSSLDVDSKILTVNYDPKKTTPEKIRLAVSKSGYDADDIKADTNAYEKLAECCKKDNVEKGKK